MVENYRKVRHCPPSHIAFHSSWRHQATEQLNLPTASGIWWQTGDIYVGHDRNRTLLQLSFIQLGQPRSVGGRRVQFCGRQGSVLCEAGGFSSVWGRRVQFCVRQEGSVLWEAGFSSVGGRRVQFCGRQEGSILCFAASGIRPYSMWSSVHVQNTAKLTVITLKGRA
jgi:hypothetical protein